MKNPLHIFAAMMVLLACEGAVGQHVDSVHGVFVMNSDGTDERPLFPYPVDARSLAVSPDGNRIAYHKTGRRGFDIWVCDSDGENAQNLTNSPEVSEYDPTWSPDARRIAFSSNRDGSNDILVMDANGFNVSSVTIGDAADGSPSWAPKGDRIAFSSDRSGNSEIYVVDVNGSNVRQITSSGGGNVHNGLPSWAPDGRRIVFVSIVGFERHVYTVDVGGGPPTPVETRQARSTNPSWSPDGSLIAFESDLEGVSDIYVVNTSGGKLVNLTKGKGGNSEPSWLPDGRIVFATRRLRADMQMLGPTTVTTILEEGGVSMETRNGSVPPFRLRRTRSDGSFEYIPLNREDANRLLREQGLRELPNDP